MLVGLPLGLAALGLTNPNANAQTETNLCSIGPIPYEDVGSVYPSGLVQGSDGNFYGTTEFGGTNADTTVFQITPSGSYTNLYTFGGRYGDEYYPSAGLVQGSDGNFYGTTSAGGTNSCNCGTVFRISPSGSYTNLHSFAGYPVDGAAPYTGVVQGSDDNFYGTTKYGGTNNDGSVFRISPSGTCTTLYSFASSEYPNGLVQGSDGDFYGTTHYGSATGAGTVFRISPSGTYTILYSFIGPPTDGYLPVGRLAQGSDGNFYGTTITGGTNGCSCGTVFRISPSGTCTTLYSFVGSPNDGQTPGAGLVQGSDGNFYGTTEVGGKYGPGTVFRLSVPLNLPANQISEIQFFNVLDSTIVALPIPSVARERYQLQYTDSMSPVNWINTGGTITSIGGPLVLIDLAEPLPPQRFYRAVITP